MKGWVRDLNRAGLVDAIYQNTGDRLHKYQIEIAIDAFCNTVLKSLEQGEKVKLVGFGEWYLKRRAARTGRDIVRGKSVYIPARISPAFKPGIDMVNAAQCTYSGKGQGENT